jgi:hypothetical protein
MPDCSVVVDPTVHPSLTKHSAGTALPNFFSYALFVHFYPTFFRFRPPRLLYLRRLFYALNPSQQHASSSSYLDRQQQANWFLLLSRRPKKNS